MPRLTKIVTRTGDTGETGLADGSRPSKTDRRVEAIGEIDELNCTLGVVLTHPLPAAVRTLTERIQHELFDLGGELSFPRAVVVDEAMLTGLDAIAAELNGSLPPLEEFVLPGGCPASAAMHFARAVARRAERAVWRLAAEQPINPLTPRYLNRLSDVLFICARLLVLEAGGSEIIWRRRDAR